MMIYNFGSAVLRAVGDTRRPLIFLSIAGVVNVIFNLFFVICLKMSVAGVAIATVISQFMSAILVVICLMKEESDIKLIPGELKIDMDSFKRILLIGIPAGLQGTLFSLSNVVIQSSVNKFGSIIQAGNAAAQNLEGFVYVAMNSFHQATLSFTSQNVGAGRYDRTGKILLRGIIAVFVVGLVLGGAVVLSGNQLLKIYTRNNAERSLVIKAGYNRLIVVCGTYFLCGIMDVLVGAIRGLGYSILPMIVSLVGACGLRIFWLETFFKMKIFHRPSMIYITYPVSWALTICAHVVCYMIIRKKFMKHMQKMDFVK